MGGSLFIGFGAGKGHRNGRGAGVHEMGTRDRAQRDHSVARRHGSGGLPHREGDATGILTHVLLRRQRGSCRDERREPREPGAPGWDAPDVDAPDLDVLDLDVPDWDVPDWDVPDWDVPDWDVPDLEVPGRGKTQAHHSAARCVASACGMVSSQLGRAQSG